jgi:hypothetical protein
LSSGLVSWNISAALRRAGIADERVRHRAASCFNALSPPALPTKPVAPTLRRARADPTLAA